LLKGLEKDHGNAPLVNFDVIWLAILSSSGRRGSVCGLSCWAFIGTTSFLFGTTASIYKFMAIWQLSFSYIAGTLLATELQL
jgi:hypothetical protein